VLGFDRLSVGGIQVAGPGLSDHGQRPDLFVVHDPEVVGRIADHGVTRHADVVCIGRDDRPFEPAGLLHPVRSGHLPVAVENGDAGEALLEPGSSLAAR